jgi:hypothetical protein
MNILFFRPIYSEKTKVSFNYQGKEVSTTFWLKPPTTQKVYNSRATKKAGSAKNSQIPPPKLSVGSSNPYNRFIYDTLVSQRSL